MRSLTCRGMGVITSAAGLLGLLLASQAGADGTETLGPPSVAIAPGSGIAIGGAGLHSQPGTISVTVPPGATVNQVLLYWEGDNGGGAAPDDTIVIEGTEVTGTLLGGPTTFFADVQFAAFRADITGLGLVSAGANSLEVSGLTNNFRNNGAGVAVIYDDGTDAELVFRDGLDLAFVDFSPPLDTTAPQTYTFAAEPADRTATLSLFAASVEDEGPRPNAIDVTVGATTTRFTNPFTSQDGREWDSVALTFTIPAGATSVTAQALSVGDGTENLPASFAWIMSTLTVPTTPPPSTTTTTTTVPETTTTTVPETTTTTTVPETTTTTVPETTTTVPPTTTTTEPAQVLGRSMTTSTTSRVQVASVSQARPLPRTGSDTGTLVRFALGSILVGLVLIGLGNGSRPLTARRR